MEKKTQTQDMKKWAVTDIIFMILQVVLSVLALYYLKKLLPMKYWIIVAILLIIAGVTVWKKLNSLIERINISKRRKLKRHLSKKKRVVKVFSGIINAVLIIGCLMAGKGFDALDKITGEVYQTQLITVVVKSDSAYQELKDVNGNNIGVVPGIDDTNKEKALTEIKEVESVEVTPTEYASVVDLGKALINGEVEVILLNEAYRGIIEDEISTFSSDTKVIYECELKEKIEIEEKEVEVTDQSFSIYLSGIDTYGKVSTVSRSDVNMIVTVNPETKQILMTSVPRDYYVELASFGKKDKLTHAGVYGVEESMKTLENLFGIEIDYYARVNFSSLIKMVDALGGIEVYNDYAFTSYHTHEYYKKGAIYMDGETALEFVRERYGLPNGDNDRVKNQQKVLAAMIDKAISPKIITNYGKILDAVSDSFTTNMSSKDIQKLIQMQLDEMTGWEIIQQSVTGTGSKSSTCYSMPGRNAYVMIPDDASVIAAKTKINEVMNAK